VNGRPHPLREKLVVQDADAGTDVEESDGLSPNVAEKGENNASGAARPPMLIVRELARGPRGIEVVVG
jgi:hypothetical protein